MKIIWMCVRVCVRECCNNNKLCHASLDKMRQKFCMWNNFKISNQAVAASNNNITNRRFICDQMRVVREYNAHTKRIV